ncbi:MAG: class II glutamine amidotransferase [Erysipelotrichaceae bacterium]|nr:class II glutamine amidotransferase [Erysipelotrichaceae bacterium]
MCELFGICANKKYVLNDWLKEFYSHSVKHPDGWGLALFEYGVNVEKEPIRAKDSAYLRKRLSTELSAEVALGHIRLASVGKLIYDNCHPFVRRDNSGRVWTLMHNGTIFTDVLDSYKESQVGTSDSERILMYLMDKMNEKVKEVGHSLSKEERIEVVEKVILKIVPNNKVNLIFYDGEYYYVHTNCEGTLYRRAIEEGVVLATVPLDKAEWSPVKMNTLLVFEAGKQVYTGSSHEYYYVKK